MRIANVRGRLTLLADNGGVDVASQGRFGADPQATALSPARRGPHQLR